MPPLAEEQARNAMTPMTVNEADAERQIDMKSFRSKREHLAYSQVGAVPWTGASQWTRNARGHAFRPAWQQTANAALPRSTIRLPIAAVLTAAAAVTATAATTNETTEIGNRPSME